MSTVPLASGEPPAEITQTLGVRVLHALGGRLNFHWLVESAHGRYVLRRWADQPLESVTYERRLLARLQQHGWPVAPQDTPVEFDGKLWSLSPYLPGEPRIPNDSESLRHLGRLLAEFHAVTGSIEDLGQRPGWRRGEAILNDSALDEILSLNEASRSEEVRIVRWHLDRARQLIEGLELDSQRSLPIHGDFTLWNLRFQGSQLTGLLDFELAHQDHWVADFALAWRGKYDEVIEGYEEASPLEPAERAAIVPLWWAMLIEGACRDMQLSKCDDGWTVHKLLERSSAVGLAAEDRPSSF